VDQHGSKLNYPKNLL